MGSAWKTLSDNIADNSRVVESIAHLTTTIKQESGIGMDVLQVVCARGPWGDLVGTFHVGKGVGPNRGEHSQLYVATASSEVAGGLRRWKVTNNGEAYSQAGSMGFIKVDPVTGAAFLAYELESSDGNTIAIRRYKDIAGLVGNESFDEIQLTREVHVASSPNTWTAQPEDVQNVGTPSIESFYDGDINLRFHYSPDGAHDYPGKGIVSFGAARGVVEHWGSWSGVFSNWVNNALRGLGAQGKIGGRDVILWNGEPTYIYEAQLVQDQWVSWRPFLLVPGQQEAHPIPLIVDCTDTFANPHMVLLPGNRLLQTYFIPSEALGSLARGTYLRVTQLPRRRAAGRPVRSPARGRKPG